MSDDVYKLRMAFEGLCAFVYNNVAKAMTVLLIDGRKPGVSSGGNRFLVHVPSVQVKVGDLLEGSIFDFVRVYSEHKEAIWALDGDDIYLRPGEAGQLLGNKVELDDRFNSFIPTMDKIHKEEGGVSVDPKYFASSLNSDLVAKMRFTSGKVNVDNILNDKFEFSSGIQMDVARTMVIDLEFDTDTVTFGSRNRDGQEKDIFKVKLRQDSRVEVAVKNMPPSTKPFEYEPANDFLPDFDFEMVYKIMSHPPKDLPVPFAPTQLRVPKKLQSVGATVGHQVCSHARFNNSELA